MPKSYENAWKDFIKQFGGAYDGVSKAAEHGSTEASRDMKVYNDVESIVDEVADEHDVEEVWEL